jgi:sucrose phosphorylase
MLDCHDGIPVQPDLDGILEIEASQEVVQACLARGANLSRILSIQHKRRADFDAHQINCTYYSALGGDDQAYLAARAIQFFTPGVPQVYYVGLLAGENDQAAVARSGEGRAINRRNYASAEVELALQQPVVQRLLRLIRFRNEHPAFGGQFVVPESGDRLLRLSWQKEAHECVLNVDLDSYQTMIEYREACGRWARYEP